MPPAAAPSQHSEPASAGTERASPISAAIDLRPTAVIHGAPNDMPRQASATKATIQDARVSMDRVSMLWLLKTEYPAG
jgi:hypothetical protein